MPEPALSAVPLKAVLFDLDQTLCDKNGALAWFGERQYREFALDKRGIAAHAWGAAFFELHSSRIPKSEVYAGLGRRFGLPHALRAALLADLDAHFYESAAAFTGVTELLARVRALGLKTAVVTNGRDFYQRAKIAALGIEAQLDVIVTSGQAGMQKPDLRIFMLALQQLGCQPGEAVFVGDDAERDILPARRLGMAAVRKLAGPEQRDDSGALFASHSLPAIGVLIGRLAELRARQAGSHAGRSASLLE